MQASPTILSFSIHFVICVIAVECCEYVNRKHNNHDHNVTAWVAKHFYLLWKLFIVIIVTVA